VDIPALSNQSPDNLAAICSFRTFIFNRWRGEMTAGKLQSSKAPTTVVMSPMIASTTCLATHCTRYRGILLKRNSLPLGAYSSISLGQYGGPRGGGRAPSSLYESISGCMRICSARVGVAHRPLVPAIPTGGWGRRL